jgi:hypothetical protein
MKQQLPGMVLATTIDIALSRVCIHVVVAAAAAFAYDFPDYKIEQLGDDL